ncbi:MAG TPA: hypothetical protein VFS16_20015 [Acidimicrobiia bacterium]|nr:hypothetical protein [Acidimicrobiia bacterium]
MNHESKPWASDTGSIALETEPLVFFHPILAGTSPPGFVQPVQKAPLLEEEPVTWLTLGGAGPPIEPSGSEMMS